MGRPEPRPGREDELSPSERKAIAKAEPVSLTLSPDSTYEHRGCLSGTWKPCGDHIRLTPLRFMGRSREEQETECAERGVQFRFAFVFEPLEILNGVEPGTLEELSGENAVRTVYRPA